MKASFGMIVLVVAIVVAFVQTVRVGNAQDLAESNRVRADSIAADAAVARLQADSTWEVRFAENTDNLNGLLANGDSAQRLLAEELGEANIRVGLLAEVNASARGQVISLGNLLGVAVDGQLAAEQAVDSLSRTWGGDIDDGLLVADWQFTLPEIRHTLNYDVTVPGELIVSVTGDGRTLVTARATHERATLNLGQILVDPPPPVEVRKLSFTQALLFFGVGVVTWELVR